MLEFNKMEFENFQSFEGHHEFLFAKEGMHLISGVNLDLEGDEEFRGRHSVGSGKSSFTMVPQFALFGSIAKGTKKDSVINKRIGKDMRVALDFSVNGDRYLIERYRKHYEFKNGLFLFELANDEWNDITRSDIPSTQKAIDALLPWNHETFLKIVLLSREDLQQFLDYGPPERWRIFESIIKLEKLVDYREIIRRKKKTLYDEMSAMKTELSGINVLANRAQTQANEEESEAEELAVRLIKEIDEMKKSLDMFMKNGSMEAILAEAQVLYTLGQQFTILHNKGNDIDERIKKGIDKIKETQGAKKYAEQKLFAVKKYLDELKPTKCDSCGAIQKEADFKKTLALAQADVIWWEKASVDNIIKCNKEEQEFEILIQDGHNNTQAIGSVIKKLDASSMPEYYKEAIVKDGRSGRVNETVEKLQLLSHNIALKKHELSGISDARAKKCQVEADEYRKSAKKISSSLQKLEATFEELIFLESALDVREENSIKQYAVSTVMPVFNELLRQNLDQAFDDQLTIVLDQLFNETILYNGIDYGYHELSTGERVKLNLCVNLAIFDAMRLNVMGSSAVFLDEIFTNIDAPSISTFASLFREKYSNGSAVYAITHQAEAIEAIAPQSVTTIVKENGASRIETSMSPTV